MTNFYIAAHALIKKGNKYLVTKRSLQNDYMPMKWDIPGGTVEPGETIENALNREVKEETGITINVGCPLYIYTNFDNFPVRQTFQSIYLCKFIQGEIILNPQEHDQYYWLEKKDLYEIDSIAFLKEFIHKCKELI
jgi:8-oxo-dGTP diphosphatase